MPEKRKHEDTLTLDLVIATRENTKNLGYFVDDTVVNPGLGIPFYKTVLEGANYEHADWKDQACVRTSQIHWREDHSVSWLERHMEMTQGFIVIGKNPGLFVLGEPTHDREDLDEKGRTKPDPDRVRAYIIPAGMGLILKKGTWHDFPVSCGPPLSAFIINTEEVVEALATMPKPAPMNHGDCFSFALRSTLTSRSSSRSPPIRSKARPGANPVPLPLMGKEGMARTCRGRSEAWLGRRQEGHGRSVVNVEVFVPGSGGPPSSPTCSPLRGGQPRLAGLWQPPRLAAALCHVQRAGMPATAVVNSEAAKLEHVAKALKESGWELGAHGLNTLRALPS